MLPKIELPLFSFVRPSTQEEVYFRPFKVKEEKILLIANESDDPVDKLLAIRQIVANCCQDVDDVLSWPPFDLEFAFLKIRAKTVGNEVELKYRDTADNNVYSFVIDLDTIEVKIPENHTRDIELAPEIYVKMKYPTYEMEKKLDKNFANPDNLIAYVKACVEYIADADNVYSMDEYSDKQVLEWLEDIPSSTFNKIVDFFDTIPTLTHELKYTDSFGTEKTIPLVGINDFFQ